MAQKRKKKRTQQNKRRAYDQAKAAPRSAQSGQKTGSRGTRSGYQEQTISLETGGTQTPPRRRADNSIEFPTQQVRRNAQSTQNRNSTRSSQSRRGQNARTGTQGQQQRPTQSGQRLRPTQATVQDPVRRERRKQRRVTRAELRRRRIMRRITAFVLLLCVIAAGIYLTVTMLFKINSIQVQLSDGTVVSEAGGYTSDEIIQALGVHLDENIFSFDPADGAKTLEKQFPMLEQIEVLRRYPTSVVIRVVEATPTWAMNTEKGWLTLSSTLKILDRDSVQPALPTLYGGEPVSTTPGSQLAFAADTADAGSTSASESTSESSSAASSETASTDTRLDALNTLLTALNSRGMLADVTRIEFANTEELAFLYQDRISVLLGTLNELDYKMDFAQYLLLNTDGKGCAATDTGELDCSHVRSDGTLRPILAQGEPTLPSGYIVGATETVAEPEASSTAEETAEPEATAAPEATAEAEATAEQDAAAEPET